MTSELRPAVETRAEVLDQLLSELQDGNAWDSTISLLADYADLVQDLLKDREAVRAETVKEIVAWLNRRAGQVLQLHAEAKTDHERNIVDEHASAIEQSAIEIEAKFGGSHD